MYSFGAIVLIPFPFTDLTATKVRPAVIISKTNKESEDLVVAFITSRPPSGKKSSARFHLPSYARYFGETGLKVDSYVCLNKVATLHKKLILGELGIVPKVTLKQMGVVFRKVFGF